MAVNISLANDSERERQTRDQLVALLQRYDLDRWLFTDVVRIEQGVIPHSHPVLTLNTYVLGDDARLLAIYLHEQLHWFCDQREAATERAIEELRGIYPVVPVGLPEGAKSEFSSYLHLVIGDLEYAALIDVVGPDDARQVIEGWCQSHYTWIYATVLRDFDMIEAIVARHDLLP
jgi:hypothetical protein